MEHRGRVGYSDICRYHRVVTDILIRGVPENVVAEIDVKATTAGLSRAEYLRRVLLREQADSSSEVTVESLARIAQMCSDLGRPEVMAGAWT